MIDKRAARVRSRAADTATADVSVRAPAVPKREPRTKSRPDFLQVLRDRIASHDLSPGSKLREQDVAVEFGVSRARVREALAVLEQRGLIERIPNRGAVVTRLTAQQVFDLYDCREVLEGLAVRLATQKAIPQTWDDLIGAFGEPAEAAISSGELEIYAQMLTAFRKRMIDACDNGLLVSMLDTLNERTAFLVRRLIMVPGRAMQGLQDYRAMLAAMRRGHAEEAEQIKRANLRAARETFRRYQNFVL